MTDIAYSDTLSHLLRRSHFQAEALFARIFAPLGITSRQHILMAAIALSPGASQRVISEAVSLDVNTVSDTLRRMERKGLVSRSVSESDSRSVSVALTAHGMSLLETSREHNQRFQDTLTARLSPEEMTQMRRLLHKMLKDDAA